MRRFVKTLLGKPVATDKYGPNGIGREYRCQGKNGVTYHVSRHQWVLPATRWAWKAEPVEVIATGQKLDRYRRYLPGADGVFVAASNEDRAARKNPNRVETVYADTLEELVVELGYDEEEIAPGSTT